MLKHGCNKKDVVQILKLRKNGMTDIQIGKKLGILVEVVANHTQEKSDAFKELSKRREIESAQGVDKVKAAQVVGKTLVETMTINHKL